jgi:hypothetical protein
MKTIINKLDADWKNIKNKCRTTVGKEYTDNEPNSTFKLRLLISEHSPIRLLGLDWSWKAIPSWVATHWSRHKWECFISTQRTDRTGVDRRTLPQDSPVNFDGNANAQNIIDTMRKRLCYQASRETRELAEDLKETLMMIEPELGEVLVPNCIYRCGCPEFESCGYWAHMQTLAYLNEYEPLNIQERYAYYNKLFKEGRSRD